MWTVETRSCSIASHCFWYKQVFILIIFKTNLSFTNVYSFYLLKGSRTWRKTIRRATWEMSSAMSTCVRPASVVSVAASVDYNGSDLLLACSSMKTLLRSVSLLFLSIFFSPMWHCSIMPSVPKGKYNIKYTEGFTQGFGAQAENHHETALQHGGAY